VLRSRGLCACVGACYVSTAPCAPSLRVVVVESRRGWEVTLPTSMVSALDCVTSGCGLCAVAVIIADLPSLYFDWTRSMRPRRGATSFWRRTRCRACGQCATPTSSSFWCVSRLLPALYSVSQWHGGGDAAAAPRLARRRCWLSLPRQRCTPALTPPLPMSGFTGRR
jgi:hypothetical protein